MSVSPRRRDSARRLPIDWDHLTSVVRAWARDERIAGKSGAGQFPQREFESYRAAYEQRLADQERRAS